MKTINLDEYVDELPFACATYRHKIKTVLKELCNDVIDLCAESAEAGYKYCGKDPDVEPYVLKNSILDVKKQIV